MAAVENNKKDFTKNHIINWYLLNVACVKEDGRTISKAFTTRLFVMADSCGEAEKKSNRDIKEARKEYAQRGNFNKPSQCACNLHQNRGGRGGRSKGQSKN